MNNPVKYSYQSMSYAKKARYLMVLLVLTALALVLVIYSHSDAQTHLQHQSDTWTPAKESAYFLSQPLVKSAESGLIRSIPAAANVGLAAFPGAQGEGAASQGGRGGKVLMVERLDDPCPTRACTTADLNSVKLATPGTLRWALLQEYPRTVVFRVSGIIRLQEDLVELIDGQQQVKRSGIISIRSPFLTIAGQTAPAGGITIAGNGISIETHDVVLRYLRFRTGRGAQAFFKDQQNPETLMISDGAQRVIVDHCSFSWMPAEGVSVYTGTDNNGDYFDDRAAAQDVTLSWNIIGEGLIQHEDGRGHPNAAFMSGFEGDEKYASRNITLHHNLLLHTQKRNGDLLTRSGRLVNNLFYNWQWLPTVIAGGVQADIIANVWKPGPMTIHAEGNTHGIHLVPAASELDGKNTQNWWHAVSGSPSLFLSGNAFGGAQRVLLNQLDLLCYYRDQKEPCREDTDPAWLRRAALPDSGQRLVAEPVNVAEQKVLQQAGASQRINHLGQWVANRDIVDERYVNDYRVGGYMRERFPWHQDEVGGYPQQIEGAPYPDQDRDGMSDLWEVKQGLDSADGGDANLVDGQGEGYTHLERFINGIRQSEVSVHSKPH